MEKPNTLDLLIKNIPATLQIVKKLNDFGIVTDEEQPPLFSSVMIENWTDECFHLLIKYDYRGGKIDKTSYFSNKKGAIYCIFDSNEFSEDEAREKLKKL